MIAYSREFICLCECLSFAKAAKKLNVSQPTLSRHILELETQLGFKLFSRNPLSLTAAGKYYLEAIVGVIERIDAIVAKGREIDTTGNNSLTVSMAPFDLGVYSNIVYDTVAFMRRETPGFQHELYSSRLHTEYEAVLAGRADVAVMFREPEELPESIACDLLLEFPCMIWAHEGNPALSASPLRVEDFSRCKLVNSTNKVFQDFFEAEVNAFRQCGIELGYRTRDAENMADFFSGLQLDEIKVTSAMEIASPYNRQLRGVMIDDPRFRFPTYLVYRKDSGKLVVDEFVRTCKAIAKRYEKGPQGC